MLTTATFLLRCSSSLLILSLIHFIPTCDADCATPSTCGIISHISHPFRLKGDQQNCGGGRRFELVCENNVTSFYFNSQKYYVKEINYGNSSIRLVDASLDNADICSFPIHSLSSYNFANSLVSLYPYSGARPLNFMRCPHPLMNSSFSTNITDCASSSFNTPGGSYVYVKLDHMSAWELPQTCELDRVVMTSWPGFEDLNNVSLSEIHRSLLYGFELWFCSDCPMFTSSKLETFVFGNNSKRLLLIPLSILVFIIAGVSLPVTIIIGLTGALVLLFTSVVGIPVWADTLSRHTFGYNFLYIGLVICGAIIVFLSAAAKLLGMIIIGLAGVLALLVNFIEQRVNNRNAESEFIFTGLISNIIILAPRIIIFPLVMWLLIFTFRRRHRSMYSRIESFLQSDNKLTLISYSYSDIKKMTLHFKDKLGEGGYGSVYKGKLRSGHHVAVKLLGKSGASGQDFMNEIATIGRIHHVNVVKLVGYCAQGSKRALIYDFMPNGSLEKYLFDREKMYSLNWDTKFEIAIGVARGIEYLHLGCDVQILHFDIKPHNILLDDKFNPKISDFGLAKFCSTNKNTVTVTAARGTIGYVAPELINRGIGAVSYKADVYSFGMLLMEIVGLKNRDLFQDNSNNTTQYFPNWIYDNINKGKDVVIGKDDENNSDDTRKVGRKMTIVALWCIQMNPDDRPSMNKVLEMLEGDVERLQTPDYPSQSTQMVLVNMDQSSEMTTFSTDSVPFLYRDRDDASSSFQITVED